MIVQHYLLSNKNTFFPLHSVGKLRNWRKSNPVLRRSSGDCWRNQVRPFRETLPGSVSNRHTTPLLDQHLSASAEHLKTTWDKRKEEELMGKLLEIVNDRNAILEGLDEDRLRWVRRPAEICCRLILLHEDDLTDIFFYLVHIRCTSALQTGTPAHFKVVQIFKIGVLWKPSASYLLLVYSYILIRPVC